METVKHLVFVAACMRLLLVVSTIGKVRDVGGLSSAAVRAGHNVSVFFNEESVKLLQSPSQVESLYADLLACRASCADLGIGKEELIANARMSSLAELVDLLEQSDKVVFLG